MKEVAKAIVQIFSVLKMFGFKAGSDIRMGSFMQMFEEDGNSSQEVDLAIGYMLKRNWLVPNQTEGVRPGGHMLTKEGSERMDCLIDNDSSTT